MTTILPYFKKVFSGETQQEAFKRACMWVNENVMENEEVARDTFWSVIPMGDLPSVELKLTIAINDRAEINTFCNACKEAQRLFYINKPLNCDKCAFNRFEQRKEIKYKKIAKYRNSMFKGR